MKKTYINNLRGLDLLRFILSVSVIIWHYQHFFYPDVPLSRHDLFLTSQPFYSLFKVFYTHGYYAVQVFWLISGIIFFKIYQDRISSGKVSFSQFILNRFSRLYPLHFLTLIITLALQQVYLRQYESYFIYPKNTAQAFFQNLLFVQAWGENKLSFNGPTWSVSIEILVYLVFFYVCASGFLQKTKGLVLTFLFFMMIKKWGLLFSYPDLASSIYFFFAGCMLIKSFDYLKTNIKAQFTVLGVLLLLWIFTQNVPAPIAGIYDRATGFLDVDLLTFSCLIVWGFIVIFNLKLFDKIPNGVFRFFGDMTYSTYLIHFPIQLGLYLIIKPTAYQQFFSPAIFLIYFATIFILGRLVYQFFEMPMQQRIRAWTEKKHSGNH